ncbi:DUF3558 domain-containing protein [Nocardia asteroides]|uniref:DUF3558 domain-containing protein n=1 Tax=Nocardia asteroides TaxID=1824 RepID=UPI001E3C2924|nr:DUF3558 domain-containing protein [Nocardia asteroides]UGT59495.1 DUF3558 domain-containing protein [Nocardia asteroides]
MRGRFALFCALAVVPLVAGCDSGTEGSATPTSIAPEVLFDSCTLPDSVVAETGVNPDSKNDNPFGTSLSGWVGCQWRGDGYALRIFATDRTPEEFRANSSFGDFREADLPGRQATTFVEGDEKPPGNCSVMYGTSQGTVSFYISKAITLAELPDPCGTVVRAARAIDQWIPQ